jgi:uncharacterized protein YeaO (DUF488 family)
MQQSIRSGVKGVGRPFQFSGSSGRQWCDVARPRGGRLEIRRIYDLGPAGDDYRVLVDRLWPRGIRKQDAALDEWAKDLTPGTDLRRWYGHDPEKFDEFARRYREELDAAPALDAVARLRAVARERPVTLVTAVRDLGHSGARVLRDVLVERK